MPNYLDISYRNARLKTIYQKEVKMFTTQMLLRNMRRKHRDISTLTKTISAKKNNELSSLKTDSENQKSPRGGE